MAVTSPNFQITEVNSIVSGQTNYDRANTNLDYRSIADITAIPRVVGYAVISAVRLDCRDT